MRLIVYDLPPRLEDEVQYFGHILDVAPDALLMGTFDSPPPLPTLPLYWLHHPVVPASAEIQLHCRKGGSCEDSPQPSKSSVE